jgi:hypothetical protein
MKCCHLFEEKRDDLNVIFSFQHLFVRAYEHGDKNPTSFSLVVDGDSDQAQAPVVLVSGNSPQCSLDKWFGDPKVIR